jgi:hypothetical protein
MKVIGSVQRLLAKRWFVLPLAAGIGLVSAFLLYLTLYVAYFDYWVNPRGKASDPGLYIYPELRYALFSFVQLLWSIDGLIATVLLLRGISNGGSSKWTYRTLVLYFILFAALVVGGSVMLIVRSHGH